MRHARGQEARGDALDGGIEVSLRTSVEVQAELGRGCGSTAWVVSQINGSALMACLFPSRVREEIFARPDASIASVLAAPSRPSVKRLPAGYMLGGSWPFCTGCRHASWIMVGAPREGEGEAPNPGMFILPASQTDIKDDWHVSGFSGTGSNSVIAADVFVPEHLVMVLAPVLQEDFVPEGLASRENHCNPRSPFDRPRSLFTRPGSAAL